jgi:hypothetical protein
MASITCINEQIAPFVLAHPALAPAILSANCARYANDLFSILHLNICFLIDGLHRVISVQQMAVISEFAMECHFRHSPSWDPLRAALIVPEVSATYSFPTYTVAKN